MRRILCAAFALPLLPAFFPPARADDVRLVISAHGAINGEWTVSHPVDGAHFCSAAPQPWLAPAAQDTRPAPFPFYRLVFGQHAPGAELERPGPSMGLTLSNYAASVRAHSDPVNDSIELILVGRHFVGHAGIGDPDYRLSATFREDRRGGGFVAHRLQESGTGHATLDVEGNWQCPPVVADMPEISVSVHRLFPGAKPIQPEPARLRVARADIPCLDQGCARWRVTDEQNGTTYLAVVDLSRLRLSRPLREAAEAGRIELEILGWLHPGQPPQVQAVRLARVAAAHPSAAERRQGVPEASLR